MPSFAVISDIHANYDALTAIAREHVSYSAKHRNVICCQRDGVDCALKFMPIEDFDWEQDQATTTNGAQSDMVSLGALLFQILEQNQAAIVNDARKQSQALSFEQTLAILRELTQAMEQAPALSLEHAHGKFANGAQESAKSIAWEQAQAVMSNDAQEQAQAAVATWELALEQAHGRFANGAQERAQATGWGWATAIDWEQAQAAMANDAWEQAQAAMANDAWEQALAAVVNDARKHALQTSLAIWKNLPNKVAIGSYGEVFTCSDFESKYAKGVEDYASLLLRNVRNIWSYNCVMNFYGTVFNNDVNSDYIYDGVNRLVSFFNYFGARHYDISGNDFCNRWFAYDLVGNQTTFAYDAVGNITDARDGVTRYEYDPVGNRVCFFQSVLHDEMSQLAGRYVWLVREEKPMINASIDKLTLVAASHGAGVEHPQGEFSDVFNDIRESLSTVGNAPENVRQSLTLLGEELRLYRMCRKENRAIFGSRVNVAPVSLAAVENGYLSLEKAESLVTKVDSFYGTNFVVLIACGSGNKVSGDEKFHIE